MVKIIIGIADLHIPNFRGINEYSDKLKNLLEDVSSKCIDYEYDEIRIVLLGDLIHNKNNISNELIALASSFISQLEKIGKVIAIAGNHDLVLSNKSRLDTISTLFQVSNFENSTFLDGLLDYESGIVEDENINWCLYSIYREYSGLDVELVRGDNDEENKPLYIGLFHGNIVGSTMSNGYSTDKGIYIEIFKGCDIVLCGDIHKRQVLKNKGIPIIYSGSAFQQNFGETVTQHGYTIIKIDENNKFNYEFVDLETEYGYYKVEINSIDDIEKDVEVLKNL